MITDADHEVKQSTLIMEITALGIQDYMCIVMMTPCTSCRMAKHCIQSLEWLSHKIFVT